MNSKISLTYLILLIAPLIIAFREPAAKKNKNSVAPAATHLLLQSRDGGQTWQDISYCLPESEQPENFFVGKSDIYLRLRNGMYRGKSNLSTLAWEKENVPGATIAFNASGIVSFNYGGQIYKKAPSEGTWRPAYPNFEKHSVRSVIETSDGIVFIGCDYGLYKSIDSGRNWRQVLDEGWVMDLVESDGVIIGASEGGIIRSTDKGEHWETVISEGGVGIAVERIDGGFAAISASPRTLTRRVRLSWDGGKTWTDIDEGLKPSLNISSIKQIGKYLICGHPDGIFRSSDMGKSWSLVHSSIGSILRIPGLTSGDPGQVYKIYVSGDVVYAVASFSGC